MVKFQKKMLLVGLGFLLLSMVAQLSGKDQVTPMQTPEQPITGATSPLTNPWIRNWGTGDWEYTSGLYFNGTDIFLLGHNVDNDTIILLKYNTTGDFQWQTNWEDSYSAASSSLWSDNSSLYATGYNFSVAMEHQILLIKWDLEGKHLWNVTFKNSTITSEGISVWGDGAGSVYTLGKWCFTAAPVNWSGILVKWNAADGSQIWNRTLDVPYEYNPIGLSGNGTHIYTTGTILNYSSSSRDLLLLQWDASDGTILWNRTWGGSSYDDAYDLKVAGDAIYTCGNTGSFSIGSSDVFLLKWTLDGEQVWNRTWGTTLSDGVYCLTLTPDNSSIIVGGRTTDPGNPSDKDGLLLKWNASGGFQYSDTWSGQFHGGYDNHAAGICANGTSIFVAIVANSSGGGTNYQLAFGRWDNDQAVDDDEIPYIALTSPTNDTTHKSGTFIDLVISDPSALNCSLYHWDSNSNSDLAYPFDLSLPSGDGFHTLYVFANDSYGNTVQKLYRFTTDDTGPTLDLASPFANNSIYTSTTLINLSLADPMGIGTVQYYWDAETSNTTLSGSPYRVPMATGDTTHWLHAYANDTLGNLVEKHFNFTTDDTPPTLDLKPPLANNSIHVSGTIIEIEAADLNGVGKVLYHWDADITNTTLVGPSYQVSLSGAETLHLLHVYVNDSVGNLVEKQYWFTIDDTPPLIGLKDLTNNTAVSANTVIHLDLTDLSGVGTVQYSWDGINFVTLGNPDELLMPGTVGKHTLEIRVQDVAGNWATETFTLYTKDEGDTVQYFVIGIGIAMIALLAVHFVQRHRNSRAQASKRLASTSGAKSS